MEAKKKAKVYRGDELARINPMMVDGVPTCSGSSGGCALAQDEDERHCCFIAQGVCLPMVKRVTRGFDLAKFIELAAGKEGSN